MERIRLQSGLTPEEIVDGETFDDSVCTSRRVRGRSRSYNQITPDEETGDVIRDALVRRKEG